jgi:hypothetical protein
MLTPREVGPTPASFYIVPARTIRGSRAEMLADVEDAVRALMALRLVILAEAPAVQSSSPAKR